MSHCEERLTALPLPLIFLSHLSYVDKDAREGDARGGWGVKQIFLGFLLLSEIRGWMRVLVLHQVCVTPYASLQ